MIADAKALVEFCKCHGLFLKVKVSIFAVIRLMCPEYLKIMFICSFDTYLRLEIQPVTPSLLRSGCLDNICM